MVCFLALPTSAVLAILAGYETNPLVMGTIAITVLAGMLFIIAGEEQRHMRAIG
jgi:hypothetical protein